MAKRFCDEEFQAVLAGVRTGELLGKLLSVSRRDRDTFDRYLRASPENQAAYDQAKVSRSPSGRPARKLTPPIVEEILRRLSEGVSFAEACNTAGFRMANNVMWRARRDPDFALRVMEAAQVKRLEELRSRSLTNLRAAELLQLIRSGKTRTLACTELGVSESAVDSRRRRDPVFAAELTAALAANPSRRLARRFTPEIQDQMVQAVRDGSDFKEACAAVGFRRTSGDTRLATDPEFKRRMIEAGLQRSEPIWKGLNGEETERAVIEALRRGAPRCAFTSIGLPKWDTITARMSHSPNFAAAVKSAARAGRKQRIRHWNERDYDAALAGLKRGEGWRTLAERGLPGKAAVESHRRRHPTYNKRYLRWQLSLGTRAQSRAAKTLAANPGALAVKSGQAGAAELLANLDQLIPFYLDREIRKDIKQQMAADVYAGELSARNFKPALKRYIEETRQSSGYERNAVSIDAQRGQNDGHSLHNMLTSDW